ncbi:uncharacterized protein BDW47DRAFT_109814 [Aspergillus candidus]|uniref:Uncharacterized protein n=1 Tax=Aspergillus candidus TaxID=41067 RepID=A0A2I2F5E9_ASPCN|nr:hypothetical protein BDW47DRAFT_109814 [Aspergillus candidus]PLB35786.1 hypothetical protein BDW47DRAFT_109814 [Aspergillus candidus]
MNDISSACCQGSLGRKQLTTIRSIVCVVSIPVGKGVCHPSTCDNQSLSSTVQPSVVVR